MLTTPHHKDWLCYETDTCALGLDWYFGMTQQWKRVMRFSTWNVRSLYRSDSLTVVARELTRCKLDLVGVQEVRWDIGATVRAGDYNFFYGKGTKIINWEQDFLYTME